MSLFRGLTGIFVTGIYVTRYPKPRVVGQHPIQAFRSIYRSVRNRDLSSVQ